MKLRLMNVYCLNTILNTSEFLKMIKHRFYVYLSQVVTTKMPLLKNISFIVSTPMLLKEMDLRVNNLLTLRISLKLY